MITPRALHVLLAFWMVLPTIAVAQSAGSGGLAALLELRADPARGKELFAQCAGCHRKDASGRANGVFPRLAGQYATVVIKQLSDIGGGRRLNPSMLPLVSELSGNDIADIAAYLQSLAVGDKNGKGPGAATARGRQLYERDCLACHGAGGEGDAAKFHPMVAAQHYRYLLREVASIRDGQRGNSDPAMVHVVKDYSAADIEAVADYMSHLPPPKR